MSRIISHLLFFALVSVSFAQSSSQNVTVQAVTGRFALSEGPHWSNVNQKLYFVDIEKQKICALDSVTDNVACTTVGNHRIGFVIPVKGQPNKFVAGAGTDFVLVTWNGTASDSKAEFVVLATVDKDRQGTRWNDGKADSSGRFWGGTMALPVEGVIVPDQGSFYLIDKSLVPQTKISPVSISNGLAWNADNNILYYIDTPTRKIVAYDFDSRDATISNKRTIFDLKENNLDGFPDGMTIDTDGNLWIAAFGGGCVINVNPKTGKLIRIVKIPASNVSSVAFGGPLLDNLYVTTGSFGLTQAELYAQPNAGSVFIVKGLNVRGVLPNLFEL